MQLRRAGSLFATAILLALSLATPVATVLQTVPTVDAAGVPPSTLSLTKTASPTTLPPGGGPVTYTYVATNTTPVGGLPFGNVTLTDNTCAPVVLSSGVEPDALGTTGTYTCTTNVVATTTNTATITGFDRAGAPVFTTTATATVRVLPPSPLISIKKAAFPSSLPFGGGSVTYTYTVTNPGSVSLSGVTVTDNKCSPVTFSSGDTNANNKLDPSETWIYTCTTNITLTTVNTAVATGFDPNGTGTTATATATVTVAGCPSTAPQCTQPPTPCPPTNLPNCTNPPCPVGAVCTNPPCPPNLPMCTYPPCPGTSPNCTPFPCPITSPNCTPPPACPPSNLMCTFPPCPITSPGCTPFPCAITSPNCTPPPCPVVKKDLPAGAANNANPNAAVTPPPTCAPSPTCPPNDPTCTPPPTRSPRPTPTGTVLGSGFTLPPTDASNGLGAGEVSQRFNMVLSLLLIVAGFATLFGLMYPYVARRRRRKS